MNTLSEALQDYLALRRGMGYKMREAGVVLVRFVSFMQQRDAQHITTRLALQWAQQAKTVRPAEWARRLCFVRGFARYRSAIDARTEVPPWQLLPYRSTRATPYLYAEQEVRSLMDAALKLPTTGRSTPLRPWVFYCLFGLLSVTGLRISEALDLKLGDVDLGFALAADIDESHLGPNRHDAAFDGLAPGELARLDRRFEHRREIFFLIAHCVLPMTALPATTFDSNASGRCGASCWVCPARTGMSIAARCDRST